MERKDLKRKHQSITNPETKPIPADHLNVFSQVFVLKNEEPLGLQLDYRTKPAPGGVYVQEIKQGSVAQKTISALKAQKKNQKNNADNGTFILQEGDQLLGVANHTMMLNQGTQRSRFEFNKAKEVSNKALDTEFTVTFCFGRPKLTFQSSGLSKSNKKPKHERKQLSTQVISFQ